MKHIKLLTSNKSTQYDATIDMDAAQYGVVEKGYHVRYSNGVTIKSGDRVMFYKQVASEVDNKEYVAVYKDGVYLNMGNWCIKEEQEFDWELIKI